MLLELASLRPATYNNCFHHESVKKHLGDIGRMPGTDPDKHYNEDKI